MHAIQLVFAPGPLVASPSAPTNWECGCLSSVHMPSWWKWGHRRLPVMVSLFDASVISMSCVDSPMCTWLLILSCSSNVGIFTDLFVYSMCAWVTLCLPASFFVGGVVFVSCGHCPSCKGPSIPCSGPVCYHWLVPSLDLRSSAVS